jgi:hypothetical protein
MARYYLASPVFRFLFPVDEDMYGPEVWKMNDSVNSTVKSARELGRSRLI